ncbi:hypothetical protein L1987_68969 [Smallanthus sonchifolius]|uniref:Uncharacterized protein n=1 Tax=Smallanthus sonchifolius TaxID=185202 RepID=A0ACB9B9M3_9ASTR|nr:hypothetical protein L1987_68969 [Smallanthus sonchifolius]
MRQGHTTRSKPFQERSSIRARSGSSTILESGTVFPIKESALFHFLEPWLGATKLKALKEAIEIFCNKGAAGSSSAELLATCYDNILKNGGSEKLSDEAIEDTLEKVVKLLAYISFKDLFAEFYSHNYSLLITRRHQVIGK